MVNEVGKAYCANNLVVLVVSSLRKRYMQNKSENEILEFFASSKIYEDLYNFKLGYWKEGPDYLISLLKKEKKFG